MSALASPALALARAFGRFEQSSVRAVAAASGDSRYDLATETVAQMQAVADVKANLATIKIADGMWQALWDISAKR